MNRLILLAIAIQFSCAATTMAEDYLLRVDTVGYIDEPVSELDPKEKDFFEKDPKEKILKSMEVVVSPESAFHSKVSIGPQTLTIAGKIQPADGGRFKVQVRYHDIIDSGTTVLTPNGLEPLLDESSFQTSIDIAVGTPITVAGMTTSTTTTSEPEKSNRSTKTRYVLTLTKFVPSHE